MRAGISAVIPSEAYSFCKDVLKWQVFVMITDATEQKRIGKGRYFGFGEGHVQF